MEKKHIILIVGVILLIVIASIVAQNVNFKEDTEIAKRKVVINYNPDNYASAVFQVAKEKNLFEKYLPKDVEIEWTTLTAASDIRDSMVSGQIDIGTPRNNGLYDSYR